MLPFGLSLLGSLHIWDLVFTDGRQLRHVAYAAQGVQAFIASQDV